jgi:hypothetical protein
LRMPVRPDDPNLELRQHHRLALPRHVGLLTG